MGAGFAAAFAGLLGAESGLLWAVFGLWAARSAWGARPGLAWGLACVAAGLRWGTLGLQDLEAATRVVGLPPLLVGPPMAAAGCALALVAALAEEARRDDLRSEFLPRRLAAGLALLVLVPAFAAPGAGEPNIALSIVWWLASGMVMAVLVSAASRLVTALPSLGPVAAASAAIVLIAAGRELP